MSLSCHNAVNEVKEHTQFTFALAGNPNVGKSSIFNRLTGMGVVTANYPGKTVELNIATTHLNGTAVGLVDLPGTYALGAVSEDQWVARQALLDHKLDGVIVILDATNLARNLYMLLQLIDMEFPVIVALNLVDQAEKIGIKTDIQKLSELIGAPVVPTVAIRGEGLHQLVDEAIKSVKSKNGAVRPYRYGQDIEQEIENLAGFIKENIKDLPFGLSPRAVSILILEKDSQFIEVVKKIGGGEKVLDAAEKAWNEIAEKHGEDAHMRLIRERHGLAGSITQEVQEKTKKGTLQAQLMWKACTSPFWGMFILAGVLASVFAFLFYAGGFLSSIFDKTWTSFIHPKLQYLIFAVFGNGIPGKIVIWGPDAGIQAALSVGIPYVFTFYFILAFLEDSGYLNAMAFLTDRLMHRIGLHGRAALALIAGGGCNVPAIVGTRVLTTMRERIIASFLIVLTPCSARTAVIMGAVSLFVGWQWALSIYFISLAASCDTK
ncbi:MAG: ferrous iron transport protein B, partial [Firmicutes bacterium]|nr:ferrous iron transport protein B [Bacillota bacterium]